METSWPSCFDLKFLKEHTGKVHVSSETSGSIILLLSAWFLKLVHPTFVVFGTEMVVLELQVLLNRAGSRSVRLTSEQTFTFPQYMFTPVSFSSCLTSATSCHLYQLFACGFKHT